jgi:hypothetical protein
MSFRLSLLVGYFQRYASESIKLGGLSSLYVVSHPSFRVGIGVLVFGDGKDSVQSEKYKGTHSMFPLVTFSSFAPNRTTKTMMDVTARISMCVLP